MNGMERAFQLFNLADCWSDQPYDSLSRDILLQIASLSPKVSSSPKHLPSMMKIEWNDDSLPRSMQRFGYYLTVQKCFQVSEEWSFLHPLYSPDQIRRLFENNQYNQK